MKEGTWILTTSSAAWSGWMRCSVSDTPGLFLGGDLFHLWPGSPLSLTLRQATSGTSTAPVLACPHITHSPLEEKQITSDRSEWIREAQGYDQAWEEKLSSEWVSIYEWESPVSCLNLGGT